MKFFLLVLYHLALVVATPLAASTSVPLRTAAIVADKCPSLLNSASIEAEVRFLLSEKFGTPRCK